METTTRVGYHAASRAEKAVKEALESLKGKGKRPYLFSGGRTITQAPMVSLGDRKAIRVTFWNPLGSYDNRLVIVGTRPPEDPSIPEVIYVDITNKIVNKKDRVRNEVSRVIDASF